MMRALHQATATVALALTVRPGHPGVVGVATSPATLADTAVAATDPNARCVMRRGAWTPVAFERVDLGPEVAKGAMQEWVSWGPYTRTVVVDSTMWAAVWQAATDPAYSPDRVRLPEGRDSIVVDSAPVPPIRFRKDAIVFAATRGVSTGPVRLAITAIRRCRRTGVVVVHTLETGRAPGFDYPSRGFAAARVSRRLVERASVVFVDRRYVATTPSR